MQRDRARTSAGVARADRSPRSGRSHSRTHSAIHGVSPFAAEKQFFHIKSQTGADCDERSLAAHYYERAMKRGNARPGIPSIACLPSHDMTESRPIFLSSCFADPEGSRLKIRDRIRQMTGGDGALGISMRPVWMAEDYPALRPDSCWGEFEKAEFCLEGVRRTECFVAIITSRHGTKITVPSAGIVPTSFFEIELFEAALLRKPSFIFLLHGFEPERKLEILLKLLAPAFPHMDLRPLSEDDILKKIDRLIMNYQKPRWLRRFFSAPKINSTVDILCSLRHCPYDPKYSPPQLRFLQNKFDPSLPTPDPKLVESILNAADAADVHQVRLTLAWFAIRALMGAPFEDPNQREFLNLWERAFRTWISSGAWYGLHSHALMGCLAGIGSLAEIRARLATTNNPTRGLPHGPLASEYYSIAKLAGCADFLYNLALAHIELAIDSKQGNIAKQKSIRASILLKMNRHEAALSDYEYVIERSRECGDPPLGEVLSESGYAMLRSGDKRRGVSRMEEGLELLEISPQLASRVRAMRKLAEGYFQCGKIGQAIELAGKAYDLAFTIGAYDQIGPLERIARRWNRIFHK